MTLIDAVKNENLTEDEVKQQIQDFGCQQGDINAADENGRTALHWAAHRGNEQILVELLKYKPKLIVDENNHSPLEVAASLQKEFPNDPARKKILSILKCYRTSLEIPVKIPQANTKPECPQHYLRSKIETLSTYGQLRCELKVEKVFAQLTHHSNKTCMLKSSYDLGEIHHQLRLAVARMGVQAQGNVAAVAVTFELKVDEEGAKPFYVTFPIKILGKEVYSWSDIEQKLDADTVRRILAKLYRHGKAQHAQVKHGHEPKYDGSAGDAQYINHSEQPFYAYLSTPECVQMLLKRLIVEIRSDDRVAEGKTLVVCSVTNHLHSTKVPCGACEKVMVGAQTLFSFQFQDKTFGFIKNLQEISAQNNYIYKFRFPKNGPKLLSTYSADHDDKNHRKPPVTMAADWHDCRPSEIETHAQGKVETAKKSVHVVHYNGELDPAVLEKSDSKYNLNDWTIFSSGSKSNPQFKKRLQQQRQVSDGELELIRKGMEDFEISQAEIGAVLDKSRTFPGVGKAKRLGSLSRRLPAFNRYQGLSLYGQLPDSDVILYFDKDCKQETIAECEAVFRNAGSDSDWKTMLHSAQENQIEFYVWQQVSAEKRALKLIGSAGTEKSSNSPIHILAVENSWACLEVVRRFNLERQPSSDLDEEEKRYFGYG